MSNFIHQQLRLACSGAPDATLLALAYRAGEFTSKQLFLSGPKTSVSIVIAQPMIVNVFQEEQQKT